MAGDGRDEYQRPHQHLAALEDDGSGIYGLRGAATQEGNCQQIDIHSCICLRGENILRNLTTIADENIDGF